ncbi:MAG: Enoyl-(acyl-carrier-protein) reductase (NADH) FabI [Betaproteobacteria bacterium ADurb.Bin341]|nr:MAG: Enoyl-(acyl-carrier-protein) reductase (NADH) FabI [Betaproteobacteria bacterium ADurb.Bin341]
MNALVNLAGKKGLIIGMANKDSIAYGVARQCKAAGAEIAATYLNAKAEPHVRPLAEEVGAEIFLPCDVLQPGQLEAVFEAVDKKWGKLDFLIHSIAFAPLQDLHGRVVDCSLDGFKMAMDVSCHSFIRMAKYSEPLMKNGGCLINMSYYGAEKVIPNYKMMGPVKAALESATRYIALELAEKRIRALVVSPGPLRTRAASGIQGFDALVEAAETRVPHYDELNIDDVGSVVAFLVSDAARSLNGHTYYVDHGLSLIGI